MTKNLPFVLESSEFDIPGAALFCQNSQGQCGNQCKKPGGDSKNPTGPGPGFEHTTKPGHQSTGRHSNLSAKRPGFDSRCGNQCKKPGGDTAKKMSASAASSGSGAKMPQHSCPLCSFTSTHQGALESHMSSHLRSKPQHFTCRICGYNTVCHRGMAEHMEMHKTRRPGRII
ncbi:hypothetical protein Bbelb_094600 [Branchiostoma belcheri]|nr:hypothetical protein Bbelb_094600 [Branchiostoma belcheri]